MLDLGEVKIVAEVRLNGNDLGVFWMPPLQLEISNALKPGENKLEVRISSGQIL